MSIMNSDVVYLKIKEIFRKVPRDREKSIVLKEVTQHMLYRNEEEPKYLHILEINVIS